MEVKVATTSLQWSGCHAVFPQCPSYSSKTLASSKRRRREGGGDVTTGGSLACHYPTRTIFNSSAILGTQSAKLHRSKSCQLWEFSKATTTRRGVQKQNPIRRVCSANFDFFSDEEFSKGIQELSSEFRTAGEEEGKTEDKPVIIHESVDNNGENHRFGAVKLLQESVTRLDSMEPPWPEMVNHSSFLRKANSVDLPHSLRIIRRKLQEEGLKKASESTYCSVNRAFSSMVFMMEELNSFTLQMRESVLCEDVPGIVQRVQKDMHASFLWLFQRVFSHTPVLMVYVMLLLANFTVHSMGSNPDIADAASIPLPSDETVEALRISQVQDQTHQNLDSLSRKAFMASPNSKSASIGGGSSGGGTLRPIVSGEDGNGWSNQLRPILPGGGSHLSSLESSTGHDNSVVGGVMREGELGLWNSMVEEAERMQGYGMDGETRLKLVAPIQASMELDDYDEYVRTNVLYQLCLAEEPNNPLLLANYAQFLYLVTRDYERAEEYFKRATGMMEGADAEAYNKYANFLWRGRSDTWGAEEKFLEAISVEPSNSWYAASYANFLWNTGGEDTCLLLGQETA